VHSDGEVDSRDEPDEVSKATSFFVKNGDEMLRVFKDAPQVISRTLGIAERCNLRLEKIPSPFPHFDVPDGYTIDSYFEHITRQGFARRMENLRARRRAVGSSIRWQSTNRDWPANLPLSSR